jgi:hypothetical protein
MWKSHKSFLIMNILFRTYRSSAKKNSRKRLVRIRIRTVSIVGSGQKSSRSETLIQTFLIRDIIPTAYFLKTFYYISAPSLFVTLKRRAGHVMTASRASSASCRRLRATRNGNTINHQVHFSNFELYLNMKNVEQVLPGSGNNITIGDLVCRR